MKHRFFLAGILLSLLQLSVEAQQDFIRQPEQNRPSLFADISSGIPVNTGDLEEIFSIASAKPVHLIINKQFSIEGTVRSVTVQNSGNLVTVIVPLSSRPGAKLTLSKITDENGSVSFRATVVSFQHRDCLVLSKEADGAYFFEKKNFYEVFGE